MTKPLLRNSRSGRQAGFTLLEVLVALALLAILTVMLMGSLQFGTQVWRRNETSATGADLAVTYRTLQNNLERALPIPERVEQTNVELMAFDGTAEFVTFVVANPGRVGVLGDTILRLALKRDNDASFLSLSWAPYDPKKRLAIDTFNKTLTLLPGVRAVSFRYFGMRSEDMRPAGWSSEWRRQTKLPSLIAIDFETADGRQRSWSFGLRDGG